jgi:nitroreductase
MVVAAHEASSLDAASVTPWRAAVQSVAAAAPDAVDPPRWPAADPSPAAGPSPADGPSPAEGASPADGPSPAVGIAPGPGPADRVEEVILRRGSSRLFEPSPVPEALLVWGLGAATRAVPGDLTPGETLLEHLVNVHGLERVSPGPYRYTPAGGYEPVPGSPDPRGAATRLCLDQPLGGDAAFTTFHAAALDRLLEAGGARAYRAAHLEAGIVAGRLSLNASALGYGATGLTFYDSLVARYFDTVALPLLATAVGRPGSSPAPSGLPGRPAALTRYGNVAARLWARLQREER